MANELLRRKYKQAEEELADLLIRQEKLERRIARQRMLVSGLADMIGPKSASATHKGIPNSLAKTSPGLKKMCLVVLKAAYEPLTAMEVVNGLKELGFDIDRYENPVAVVTTTLKRLIKSKEAKSDEKDGKNVYRWNPYNF